MNAKLVIQCSVMKLMTSSRLILVFVQGDGRFQRLVLCSDSVV